MAFTTKRLLSWAGPVRKLFKMEREEPATLEGSSSSPTLAAREDDSSLSARDKEGAHGPAPAFKSILEQAEINLRQTTGGVEPDIMTLSEKMEIAKELYPGAATWAKDEERLFEILYLRQDLPILPSHWNIDFRGFPIPENIFQTSDEHPPVVYAHCKNGSKEFTATAAVGRLVDLTLSVRTLMESESLENKKDQRKVRMRAAELIKEALDAIIAWAARDGGYSQLRAVPNIVTEIVDTSDTQTNAVDFMTARMRALARLQQEYYEENRGEDFWTRMAQPWSAGSGFKSRSSKKKKIRAGIKRSPGNRPKTPDTGEDELATDSPDMIATPRRTLELASKKRRIVKSPSTKIDELAPPEDADRELESESEIPIKSVEDEIELQPKKIGAPSPKRRTLETPPPSTPVPPKTVKYLRKPPVVYGFYILGTSVFLLTVDSSKGNSGYISFQVDVNFADNHQSVWNALTVAIVVCCARDEIMTRLEDFPPAAIDSDSDPDA